MKLIELIAVLAILLIVINNNLNLKTMALSQSELAQQLRDVTAQNEKARLEILKRIADLEAALENGGGTTPEVDDALAALKASVQTDDDLHPDEEPPVEG